MKRKHLPIIVLVFVLLAASGAYCQSGSNIETVDILIVNGTIITMDPGRNIYEHGTVVIKDGSIIAVGPTDSFKNKFKAKKTLDANFKLVMPGLINTHTHAAMTIFRGFADDLPLQEWLGEHIWPLEGKYLNPDTARLGAQLAIAEMIRSGTTTFNICIFLRTR